MELVKGIQKLTHSVRHPVVTIGNFDGVHLGHRQILETAVQSAKARGGQCIAYTFRPHPQVALRPGKAPQLLSTYDEKLELIASLGVDFIVEEPFSREFSETEPSEFFSDILLHRLSTEVIVVGYDFAFGRERHGHLDNLRKFCQNSGVQLIVVQPHREHSEVVSSSRIREYLLSGEIAEANRLLGRPFSYRGVVVKGEGRGRKLGFPTANLKLENKLTLPYGVYATRAILNGEYYSSVTNVGIRPTFQHEGDPELPALVETHLLDTTLDLYGSTLEVQFFTRLREERRFSDIEELKRQISIDADQSRSYLNSVS